MLSVSWEVPQQWAYGCRAWNDLNRSGDDVSQTQVQEKRSTKPPILLLTTLGKTNVFILKTNLHFPLRLPVDLDLHQDLEVPARDQGTLINIITITLLISFHYNPLTIKYYSFLFCCFFKIFLSLNLIPANVFEEYWDRGIFTTVLAL